MIKDIINKSDLDIKQTKMFSKGLEMVSKLKEQISTSVFTSHSEDPDHKIQLSREQCPPLVIDDIEFHLNTLGSVKESKKIREKIIKYYNEKYLMNFGIQELTVQIVGDKYFLFVKKSTQVFYNYSKYERNSQNKKHYEKSLREIYQSNKMLKQLWSIDFCNLKVLNISRHKLSSIEGITFTNMPHLQCLQLHTNNLQSIDCLSKISTPKLRILTLYNNRIQTADKLTRLNSNKLKIYEFDRQDTIQDQKIEILDFLVKMKNFNLLEKIYIHDDERIYQSKKMYFVINLIHKFKLPHSYTSRRSQMANDQIMNDLNRLRRQRLMDINLMELDSKRKK